MSESKSRGIPNYVFDPSNPPASKQTMLDWLRINHPMEVVKSGANKADVAKIVRETQPQFFKNPASDAPAVVNFVPDHYPSLENLQVSSPMIPKFVDGPSDKIGKRAASQDVDHAHPQKRLGIDPDVKLAGQTRTASGSKITKKKKSSTRLKLSKTITSPHSEPPNPDWRRKPAKPIISDLHKARSVSSPKVSSVSNVSNKDEKRELEALKESIFTPILNQPTLSQALNASAIPFNSDAASANPFFDPFTSYERRTDLIEPKAQKTTSAYDQKKTSDTRKEVDLINFSDTEVFEVGNLVIGRDIPAIDIKAGHSSPKKKSGIDVFQEEQKRDEKVRTLEERFVQLENSLGIIEKKISKQLFEDLQQHQVDAGTIAGHSSLLEQAQEDINLLKSKVETLEVERIDLQHDIDSAHGRIMTHDRVIRKLIGGDHNIDLDQEHKYGTDDDHELYDEEPADQDGVNQDRLDQDSD